ncbi:unnamed protein product [Cuscuta epithymum]|uniref:Uncharacterized protein n=1 Tax=Cuscuta epithymum TaxID=186058 RepID=A0AAV0EN90_9ASTE|nr:unnamed protein product [Cuscuta epithymum]
MDFRHQRRNPYRNINRNHFCCCWNSPHFSTGCRDQYQFSHPVGCSESRPKDTGAVARSCFNQYHNPNLYYESCPDFKPDWYYHDLYPIHHPFEESKQYQHQERTTAPTRLNAEDPESSWSIVRHKRWRPSGRSNQEPILTQRSTKHYRDNAKPEGKANRFFFIDMEVYPPSSSRQSQELKVERQNQHNRLYYSHGSRGKQTYINKDQRTGNAIGGAGRIRNGNQFRPGNLINPEAGQENRGNPSAALQKSLATGIATENPSVSPSISTPGTGNLAGRRGETSLSPSQVPQLQKVSGRQSGNLKVNEAPKLLTWADLLRTKKDQSTPSNQISGGPAESFPNDTLVSYEPPTTAVIDPTEVIDQFNFFGEEGFDSLKIESKTFKFAVKNNEINIFEIKKSFMHRITFNFAAARQIIRFLTQLTSIDLFKNRQKTNLDLSRSLQNCIDLVAT